MRLDRRAISVLASIVLAALAAHAASERRDPSPLDGKIRHRFGGSIPVDPRPVEDVGASDPLRASWDEFRARHGTDWTIYLDERSGLPTLVSGRGIPWLAEEAEGRTTLDELDGFARRWLEENAARLGTWSDLLDLDHDASLRVREGHWQIVYRQRIDGVRVENARLDLHVVRGRMVMMGAHLWARPAVRGIPAIGAEQARGILDGYLADDALGLAPFGEPQLTLIAVDADPHEGEPRTWTGPRGQGLRHRLVWRFLLDEIGTTLRWVGEVDAHDGSIDAFYRGTENVAVRGGVFPVAPDGLCSQGGCETPGFPMPYADVTETGRNETFADSFGNLACVDPGAAFETNLIGPYVRVVDACGAASEFGTCTTGVDLGMKAGENCSTQPGRSPGNTAATRTTYYHVNRVAEIARFYDASNAWIRSPLTVNVNLSSSCNANWSGSVVNMYGAGGNCNNTGENADILVHEWGHGYDQNDGGGRDRPSEAYSDIVAILATRDSCMGRGTYNDGATCSGYGDTCLTCTGFRDFDWTARQSNTPATPVNFAQARCPTDTSGFSGPCRREPHCESYVSSEAMFDLATRDLPASGMDQDSAWQLVDRLWYQTRPGSGGDAYSCLSPSTANSCGAGHWYQRMRVADDDDGNLANGTPHAAALYAAFKRHAIACGNATDATNQSTSTCPALAAPVVTRTMTPAGVQLSWSPVSGAGEYRVYRGEMGCDRQQVPLATLAPAQTSYVDNSLDSDLVRSYRVQTFGVNRACASPVSTCVKAPPGGRLQVSSHRVVDDGDGFPEPGETLSLPVTIFNAGAETALSVAGTVDLVAPGHVRVLKPAATWPSITAAASSESNAPHFELVVLDEARCGDVLTLAFDGTSSNSPSFSAAIDLPMGIPNRDYSETAIVIIPPLTASPAIATWNVTDDKTIRDLDVTLDIFHQDPTQIIVELTSPQGTTVRLHDRGAGSGHGIETRFDRDTAPSGPGTMADFVGESTLGTWTLSVQDVDGSGVTTDGYIRPRTLHATIEGGFGCVPQTCPEPKPAGAPDLDVALVPDGAELDLVLTWSAVAGAGYHVLQSVDPRFDTGVELLGTPTAQTSLTLQDGARTTPPLTFFQARAVNVCHQEGP